ncbi:hypothetical protein I601_1619 [Nocardioides dokdonensis FR1436]|uniref:Fusaric acid resistance protein family protein n=1 Tax=Nocardioides dokdonensis FR1436 TaxID=1300347 RepID=A0A1A9GKP8_9ACTN|nr:aromatic acid exporter family protein [Nocardioides dokdonensis]ANH38051.1 hypothetical protein I601_1619 [Nocardioides dokdonensis FR1436]
MTPHSLVSRLRGWLARLREPTVQTDLLQVVKASLATVLAWVFAARLLGLEQSFLAPWVALLTVHATVYRSVLRGGQSVVATLLGVLLAYVLVEVLGYGAPALGLGVFVGLLVARWRYLRLEGVAIATTAVFLLTIGGTQEEALLVDRLLATLVGVVSGVLVNLLVVPPLDDRAAEVQLDVIDRRLGALLRRMAAELDEGVDDDGVREWIEETRRIDAEVDRAEWLLDYSRESQWWNPRRTRSSRAGDPDHGSAVLVRLEEGVAQARAIARTLEESVVRADEWDARFRGPFLALLDRVGRRVGDPDADVEGLREEIDALAHELSAADLPGLRWPLYGSLITSLRHIVTIADDVAAARPSIPT